MAEYIAKSLVVSTDNMTFSSFGIGALVGKGADSTAIDVCSEIGIDLSKHIARSINIKELLEADYIFCMDRGHKEYISALSDIISNKCYLLKDFPKKRLFGSSIWDPYKMSSAKFRKNRDIIKKEVERVVAHLKSK
jgi:protein-tyrosine phosphatase